MSAAVAYNEIYIFDVKSHDKVLMWISLSATAADTVSCWKIPE